MAYIVVSVASGYLKLSEIYKNQCNFLRFVVFEKYTGKCNMAHHDCLFILIILSDLIYKVSLQFFAAIDRASRRVSDVYRKSNCVLAWLSVWSEVQIYTWFNLHSMTSCFTGIQNGSIFIWLSPFQGFPCKRSH